MSVQGAGRITIHWQLQGVQLVSKIEIESEGAIPPMEVFAELLMRSSEETPQDPLEMLFGMFSQACGNDPVPMGAAQTMLEQLPGLKDPEACSLMSRHHEIREQAWRRYQSVEGEQYPAFIARLVPVEQLAVLTGDLNQQLEEGGFLQWYDNHHHESVALLVQGLQNVGTTSVEQVNRLVTDFMSISEAERDDEFEAREEELTQAYYDIKPAFLVDVGSYLEYV